MPTAPPETEAAPTARTLPVFALGMALSLFLEIAYLLCVAGYYAFPSLPIEHTALGVFLPGFRELTWASFGLGLAESFVWGWFVALTFGPLYNYFASRWP